MHVSFKYLYKMVFQVYYEIPMVIDSLNLKLRQIARFSSNVILEKMSSVKCHLLFGVFFLIAQHEERPLYHIHMITSRFTGLSFHKLCERFYIDLCIYFHGRCH